MKNVARCIATVSLRKECGIGHSKESPLQEQRKMGILKKYVGLLLHVFVISLLVSFVMFLLSTPTIPQEEKGEWEGGHHPSRGNSVCSLFFILQAIKIWGLERLGMRLCVWLGGVCLCGMCLCSHLEHVASPGIN